ncbi:hypothetical protein L596_021302 [Steinernema carpocapsae]|uniref:Uncharacterized protein n=1 Tax=Steinernema carpocapsae TaxID=34508 RepID=A0A4V5ZZV7_STECR|nr:hypothetical protein L596_021302 [Steinernema carpocapsae]
MRVSLVILLSVLIFALCQADQSLIDQGQIQNPLLQLGGKGISGINNGEKSGFEASHGGIEGAKNAGDGLFGGADSLLGDH